MAGNLDSRNVEIVERPAATGNLLYALAVHEAGHAVVATALGSEVLTVEAGHAARCRQVAGAPQVNLAVILAGDIAVRSGGLAPVRANNDDLETYITAAVEGRCGRVCDDCIAQQFISEMVGAGASPDARRSAYRDIEDAVVGMIWDAPIRAAIRELSDRLVELEKLPGEAVRIVTDAHFPAGSYSL